MTTTTWTGDAGTSDFNTDGNWDHGVPVAGVDAIIAGTAGAPLTVTFSSGTATANTLTTAYTTLVMQGGSLQLSQASSLDALMMSGGTLDFANGGAGSTASAFSGPVTQTAGTLEIDAGTLTLNGTNALGGSVSGGGSLVTVGATAVDGLQVANGTTLDNQGIETLTTGDLNLGTGAAGAALLTNEAGATFDIQGDVGIGPNGGGGTVSNAGLFEKTDGAGTSDVETYFNNTGTVEVDTGTLAFGAYDNTYSGTFSGAGTVDFDGPSQTWGPGLALAIENVVVSGMLNFYTDITYGGAFDPTNSLLALGDHTLTLAPTATATFFGTTIDGYGSGTLVTQGTVAVDLLFIDSGATLDNQGLVNLSTAVYFEFGGGTTAALVNEAGATFDILDDVGFVVDGGTALITNAGLFEKTDGTGTSEIETPFSSTGTVEVDTGTLLFDADGNSYSGTISGAGTVFFDGLMQTWAAGLVLTVQNVKVNYTLNIDTDVTYGGAFDASGEVFFTAGLLVITGHTLTLTATATANLHEATIVGGTLVTQGSAAVDELFIENGATLDNQGTDTLTTNYLFAGNGGTGTAAVINEVGATFDILGDVGVIDGGGVALITNAGLFEKTGGTGTSEIQTPFNSTGTVEVDTGTLLFDAGLHSIQEQFFGNSYSGTITGAGTIDFGGPTQTWAAGLVLTIQNVKVEHTLFINTDITYGGSLDASGVSGEPGALIAITGHTLTLTATATENLFDTNIAGGTLVTQGLVAVDLLIIDGGGTLDNQGTDTLSTYVLIVGANGEGTLINEAAATFDILTDDSITLDDNGFITNAGLFEKTGGTGTSEIEPLFTNTGTVEVDTGTMLFVADGNSYSGTFDGAGTVDFGGHTQTWAAGLILNVQNIIVSHTLILTADVTYGGALDAAGAAVELGSYTLTLSATATANLYLTDITGTGTLVTQGTVAVGGLTVGNGVTLDNQGTETLNTSSLYLGNLTAGTATLLNEAGSTFDIIGSSNINGAVGAVIDNAGLFEMTGGGTTTSSFIETPFDNTGTVKVDAGTLEFDASNTYAGTITGNGVVYFSGDTQTWAAGLTLTVAGIQVSGTLHLTTDVDYHGLADLLAAVLSLDGHTLTLAGAEANLFDARITGTGSLVTQGSLGDEHFTVDNGATLVNQGTQFLQFDNLFLGYDSAGTATLINDAGATFKLLDNSGIVASNGATAIDNAGLFEKTGGTGISDIQSPFDNTGQVEVDTGTLQFDGAVTGNGAMTIGSVGAISFAAATSVNVSFGAAGGTLMLGTGYTGTITNFLTGDTIDLTDLAYDPSGSPLLLANNKLQITADGTTTYLQLDPSQNFDGLYFHLAPDGTAVTVNDTPPCFAAGTRILTAHGEIAVEALRPGDCVLTRDGTARPVTWIGHRRIDIARHPKPARAQPIRIVRDAFAPGVPHRDLRLSPDHAVLLDGLLIAARLLVNGATVVRETNCRSVTYYHVELAAHDVLLAENLAAESYLDTGNRASFENAGLPLILHPDFGTDQDRRVMRSCAPFATEPTVVEPIWRRLAARAQALGHAMETPETSEDPDLRLLADGRVMRPVMTQGRRYTFMLPRRCRSVRLLSRAAAPSETAPWSDDGRRLGVMVGAMTLRRGQDARTIPPDHPALTDGWWAAERAGASLWRWTDGDALLPLAGGDDAAVLEVMLAGGLAYPVAEARPHPPVALATGPSLSRIAGEGLRAIG